ncbi:MAG: hypothetical protein KAX24_04145 [Anaerolineae bacterium]|nr:hypothetical protein [Anaerolineae bacterium]
MRPVFIGEINEPERSSTDQILNDAEVLNTRRLTGSQFIMHARRNVDNINSQRFQEQGDGPGCSERAKNIGITDDHGPVCS